MKLWDRRVAIVHYMIELTAEDDKSEVEQWKWLLKLLSFLTADGMSSDESETGVNGKIYRVTVMAWRSDVITKYMDHIDGQQYVGDKAGRSMRGAVPRPRERGGENVSSRKHVTRLPRELYNDRWFGKQRKVTVNVSREKFQWATIVARTGK
jgi:hypothetical protein